MARGRARGTCFESRSKRSWASRVEHRAISRCMPPSALRPAPASIRNQLHIRFRN